jgi:5-methylcytosine rRNA methyltransferase NSUN4
VKTECAFGFFKNSKTTFTPMAQKKSKVSLDDYFSELLGSRWPTLKESLQAPTQHTALGPDAGYLKEYFLDPASVLCAEALRVQTGESVLDMCAAPGGKTLVLAKALAGSGELVSNERSAGRRARLHRVIEEHLPSEWRKNIIVRAHDATKWGLYEQNRYDKILLDAPCSSERHVLNSPEHLAEWGPSKTKRMAQQQLAMLCAGLEALKVGGELIYSTCSLSNLENSDCIQDFFKKRKGRFELVDLDFDQGERLKYGHQFWPDLTQWGPIYLCKLRKLS